MVRQREVEESMELCMRFMMVSCEMVERKRVVKAVSPVLFDLRRLGGA